MPSRWKKPGCYLLKLVLTVSIIGFSISLLLFVQGTDLPAQKYYLSTGLESGYESRLAGAKIESTYIYDENKWTLLAPTDIVDMPQPRLKMDFTVFPQSNKSIKFTIGHNPELEPLNTISEACDGRISHASSLEKSTVYTLTVENFRNLNFCDITITFAVPDATTPRGQFMSEPEPNFDELTANDLRIAFPPNQYSCSFQCISQASDKQNSILFQDQGRLHIGVDRGNQEAYFSTAPITGGKYPQLRFEVYLVLLSVLLPILLKIIWSQKSRFNPY